MKEATLKCFLNSFKESCENNERFCFILGSGASVESGIPTGLTLAQRWYDELHDLYTEKELEELMSEQGIKDITVSSKNYFDIYNLRFYPNYHNGYAYIQRIMEKAQPSFGYYPLARQLSDTGNNLVITTNFDCMVEDALFVYTDKRPIVVAHESLAGYIKLNIERPIIAKIHRGLYFEPFNRQEELEGLKDEWQEVLKSVFRMYTPIVIGYAGGDNSLMTFLQDDSIELNGLYWCYYKKDGVADEIKNLVEKKKDVLCLLKVSTQ